MKYKEALRLAQSWKQRLAPYCERIEIAGSVRRMKTDVRDIELLCIPKMVMDSQEDLFKSTRFVRDPGFALTINNAAQEEVMIEMGQPDVGKYIKLMLIAHQIKIDLFTATKKNWGFQFAIRTGPAEYSHRVLGNRWVKLGYHGDEGYLFKDTKLIEVPEEEDLYYLLGLPYIAPKERHYP